MLPQDFSGFAGKRPGQVLLPPRQAAMPDMSTPCQLALGMQAGRKTLAIAFQWQIRSAQHISEDVFCVLPATTQLSKFQALNPRQKTS